MLIVAMCLDVYNKVYYTLSDFFSYIQHKMLDGGFLKAFCQNWLNFWLIATYVAKL